MPNRAVLLDVLTRFSRTLAGHFDVSDVPYELSDAVVEVLGATGAGVSLADENGLLRFATASNETVATLEYVQQDSQQGPCHQACRSGDVFVTDLATHDEWPDFTRVAGELGLLGGRDSDRRW